MATYATFLDRLTAEEREALEPRLQRKATRRGEFLFEQGESPDYFILVHSGAVKICRSSGLGRDMILEILFPGDLCGALCALDDRPYPVSAVCLEDGEVSRIRREDFLMLSTRLPGLLTRAVPDCQEKMHQQRQMMVGMAVERAEQRAARALTLLATRLGVRTPQGVRTPRLLDRQEFAEFIGTTVETGIRVLSRLRKDGVLQEDRNSFLIRDEVALLALADGDSGDCQPRSGALGCSSCAAVAC